MSIFSRRYVRLLKGGSTIEDSVRRILEFCEDMDQIIDEGTAQQTAVEAAADLPGVDCAGIYLPESASFQYALSAHCGFPDWLLDSGSRLAAGSDAPAIELPRGQESIGSCWYPLSPGCRPSSLLLVIFDPEIGPDRETDLLLKWLSSVTGANLRRIRALNRARKSISDRSMLLERISDPVFSVDAEMELNYCNSAFRDMVKLEELDGRALTLQQAAGRDFFQLISQDLEAALTSGGSSSLFFSYHDRIFNTVVHPVPEGLLVIMKDVTEFEENRHDLDFRQKFETLLVNIATDFIEMQGTALNLGVHDALLSIGVALGVDRAYLFQFRRNMETMTNTHEWCASNIQPRIEELQDLKTSEYPWWMNRLNLHETIKVKRLSEMPEWAQAERRLLEDKDAQSVVAVPIIHGNDLVGFLGFDSVNHEREWSEDIVDLLRIVGDAIGNALERNRMEKRMLEMYRRAEKEAQINAVLLREVNHRVKNNLSEIIGLLYAQRRFASGDFDDFILDLIGRIRGLATAHDMLSRSGWNPLELTRLAKAIVSSAVSNAPQKKKIKYSVSRSTITVDSNQAHALSLILNELVRNSIKHALVMRDSLIIKVRMRKSRSGRINLTYSDDGPGYPAEVISLEMKNLGIDLIENLTVKNLQGDLTLLNDGGAITRIGFSIADPEGKEEDEE